MQLRLVEEIDTPAFPGKDTSSCVLYTRRDDDIDHWLPSWQPKTPSTRLSIVSHDQACVKAPELVRALLGTAPMTKKAVRRHVVRLPQFEHVVACLKARPAISRPTCVLALVESEATEGAVVISVEFVTKHGELNLVVTVERLGDDTGISAGDYVIVRGFDRSLL